MEFFFIAFFLNAVLAAIVSYAASQKGRSAIGFYALSFFFSFLVGILVLLAIPAVDRQETELRECPKCMAQIPSKASKCKFCQSDVEPVSETSQVRNLVLYCKKCELSYDFEEVQGNKCPNCRKSMDIHRVQST